MAISTDSYNRANSTTTVGSTDGTGTADPLAYTNNVGTCGINTNQGYCQTLSGGRGVATVDFGVADYSMQLEVPTVGTSSGTGICFRYTDTSNYWYVVLSSSSLSVVRRVAASESTLVTDTNSGGTGTLRVLLSGNNIYVLKGGVIKYQTTDSNLASATRGGFITFSTTGRVDNLAVATFTDLSLTNAVGITNTSGVGNIGIIKALEDNEIGTESAVSALSTLTQLDTWRPVPRPDNLLILACRTPEGDHDEVLTDLTLWTFHNDGTNENIVMREPAEHGWDSYGHPEWHPDGDTVVVWAEDATTYGLYSINARDWEREWDDEE